MANDARVRYTKMVIRRSFATLLRERPLNKVTVKGICELAQINRATFYKHYADAYDLMDQMEEEALAELQATIRDSTGDGIQRTLVHILDKMRAEGDLYQALFSENGDPSFPMKVFRTCYEEVEGYSQGELPHLTEDQRAWAFAYVAQGSTGVLNCWVAGGMREPTDEVAAFIAGLTMAALQSLR